MKEHKINQNEFLEILNKADTGLNYFGYEGYLNMISGYYGYLAEHYTEIGMNDLSEMFQKKANVIFDELEKIGYYKR